MPHPFSNALYYPTIDIRNTGWLKTAVLFWDSISTIVPASINLPFNQQDTRFLSEIGYLRPLYIDPFDNSVRSIENEFIEMLYSPEIINSFYYYEESGYITLYRSKFSYLLEQAIRDIQHSHHYAERLFLEARDETNEFYYANRSFASFYMTVLANKISEDRSLAMITDSVPFDTAGNAIRYGNQTGLLLNHDLMTHMGNRPTIHNRELAQGILLNYIVEGLSISPDTPLNEVIDFKNQHRDELGRFKTELARLTQCYDNTDYSIETLKREIRDIYDNQFLPAYNSLKDALTSSRIRCIADSFYRISLVSANTAGIPRALMGLSIVQAIFAGIGLSATASSVAYNVEKRQKLRDNPYSYLLSIGREF